MDDGRDEHRSSDGDAGGDFEAVRKAGIEVRYRPETAGEPASKPMASAAAKARRRLEGLGSEADLADPVIYLSDPFPDPSDPSRTVTEGSVINPEAGEIWMVATAETPPEDPHRALALLFGAALPAADDLDWLLEGYGLHLAEVPSTRARLAETQLPPIDKAEGELRSAMAVDFVRFLLERENEETLRRLLDTPKQELQQQFLDLYGAATVALEQAWRKEVMSGEPDVKTGEFLRLSLRYLRPYWMRQVEIFMYMLLSLAFTAAFPFVSRELFDSAIPSGEFSEVATLLVILGTAFTISLVAGLRQAYSTAWVSGAVVRDLRQAMFDKLQVLPSSWYKRYQQGDVLSRLFSDVGAVQSGLSTAIGQGVYQTLTLVVSATIMLTINMPLGLIVLVGAPLVAIVYRVMAKGAQERSIDMREENSALLSVAAENYSASPVVKMFGLRRRESERFDRAASRLFRAQRRLSLFGGLFGLSVNMIVTLLRLGVLGFGAWLILEGRFTLGGLVAFLAIMGEVINPVTVLTSLGQNIQASMGALIRINEVLDADTEPMDGTAELPALRSEVRLSDVSFSYTPERRALDQIDAVIPAGSKVAFVGPSGSGKSTVLRLLMRMHDPEEGTITLDGIDTSGASLASLRSQMGVVFQEPFLFNTTIRENIALGKPGATQAEIEAAAAAAEVDVFVDQFPRGYDTLVGERGSNLSGGQRQRVSIARALIRDPRLLLLDEATSALDAGTERQINATISKAAGDRTVIAVTHRLTSITEYDRIFVIDAGRLVEVGTHDELVSMSGLYARLWGEQTGAELLDRPPFDAAGALGRIVFLRGLPRTALESAAARLRAFVLQPGETVSEGTGGIVVLAAGRAEVLTPSLTGDLVATTEVGPGDAFGVRAILGNESGARLRAIEPVTLLELDAAAIAAVAAAHPDVAAAMDPTRPTEKGPAAGRKVAAATFAAPADRGAAARATAGASRMREVQQ